MQILVSPNVRVTDGQSVDVNVAELKRIARGYKIAIIAVSSFNRNNYHSEVRYESF
jgi:replicative DNA helicase